MHASRPTTALRPTPLYEVSRESWTGARVVAGRDFALSEDIMRILLIVSTTLALNTIAYGQSSESRLERTITREQILALPRRNAVPRLTLQRALKIAEAYVKKERLGISSRYLFEARWVSYDTVPETGAWEFWWVSTRYGSDDVRVAVSLDGKPKRLPIPSANEQRRAPDRRHDASRLR
jgi:hypothetical protein